MAAAHMEVCLLTPISLPPQCCQRGGETQGLSHLMLLAHHLRGAVQTSHQDNPSLYDRAASSVHSSAPFPSACYVPGNTAKLPGIPCCLVPPSPSPCPPAPPAFLTWLILTCFHGLDKVTLPAGIFPGSPKPPVLCQPECHP